MKLLIDECLHTSLVFVGKERGHQAWHVNWLGLSGTADRDLMPRIIADDFTFITNNARDFRRLYAREPLHAGLLIVVPQVVPALQRTLLAIALDELGPGEDPIVNQVLEVGLVGSEVSLQRYGLPA